MRLHKHLLLFAFAFILTAVASYAFISQSGAVTDGSALSEPKLTALTAGDVTLYLDDQNHVYKVEQNTGAAPTSKGYIVEFEGNPVVAEKARIEKVAQNNEQRIAEMSRYNPIKYAYQAFATRETDVESKVVAYEGKLAAEQQQNIELIRKTLGKPAITGNVIGPDTLTIETTYKNAFNGISIDITEDEAAKIKTLSQVKNVYPNQEVHLDLMDSVPLIEADKVWGLVDSNGDNITGKNVTIGIIDTGIDYSHTDLGQSYKSENELLRVTDSSLRLIFDAPWSYEIDQLISMSNNKLIYYDYNKLFAYDFASNSTTKLFESSAEIVKLNYDGRYVAFATSNSNDNGVLLYDFEENTTQTIFSHYGGLSFGTISVENGRVVFGVFTDNATIYIYSIADKILDSLSVQSSSSQFTPVISGDLLVYSVSSGYCYDHMVLYNMATGEQRTITPPDVGPPLDFNGDEILYADCSKTQFDPSWTHYHIYNLTSGASQGLVTGMTSTASESKIDSSAGTTGWINKGTLNRNYVFMSKDVNAHNIMVYDRNKDRYAQINYYTKSGVISADGSTVCFISSDNNIYCHTYNSSYGYPPLSIAFNQKVVGGYDFVNNDNEPLDDHGHGTHVAATSASNGVLKGVAPDAQLYGLKVLDSYGSGYWSGVISGIEWAVDPDGDGDFNDHLEVISLSLGGDGNPQDPVSIAINNAVDAGVVAVIAAGNSGGYATIGSPGTAAKAITVGATDKLDSIAYFSSRGPVIWNNGSFQFMVKPDVVAPGVDICAAQYDSAWATSGCYDADHIAISGTSMATPHVSGLAALLLQAHPQWTPEQVKMALRSSAVDLGNDITEQGYGRVNATAAVLIDNPPVANLDEMGLVTDGIDIHLTGSVHADNLLSYSLEYKSGLDNGAWTLITTSTSMNNQRFDVPFNTNSLQGGYNQVRLIVRDRRGESEDRALVFKIDVEILFEAPGDISHNSLNVGDINNDGRKEIIFATSIAETNLYAVDMDGRVLSGFPISIDSWYGWDGPMVISTPSLADLDNDGDDEIIIISGNTLYAIDGDGTFVAGFPLQFSGSDFNRDQVVADLDNDRTPEVIYLLNSESNCGTTWCSGNLHVTDATGNERSGFPVNTNTLINFAPSVGDVDGDGLADIVYAGGICHSDGSCSVFDGGVIGVVGFDGAYKSGWPVQIPVGPIFAPVLADLDKDGTSEVISVDYGGWIRVFDLHGNQFQNWDGSKDCQSMGPIIVGDVNGDDIPEIVIGGYQRYCVYDVNGNPLVTSFQPSDVALPVVGDFGSGGNIFYSDANSQYFIKDALSEQDVPGWPQSILSPRSGIVTDLENDGLADFLGYSMYGAIAKFNHIVPYNDSTTEWPMYKHDAKLTGSYELTSVPVLICGNNIREGTEQCDGSDDAMCSNRCSQTCSCLPKSIINNSGSQTAAGNLIIDIRQWVNSSWQVYKKVINQQVTIPGNSYLALDKLWNGRNVSVADAGTYKVYAEFDDGQSKISDERKFQVSGKPQCTIDSDCPSDEGRYCSGNDACYEVKSFRCELGQCVPAGGSGTCQICPNGCSDGYCNELRFQEDPSSSSVTDNYLYVTYAKPENTVEGFWEVKHGFNKTSNVPFHYNISIPAACFNEDPLQFRIKSDTGRTGGYGGSVSQPECYNGSNYVLLGIKSSGSAVSSCINGGTQSSQEAIDGDWSSETKFGYCPPTDRYEWYHGGIPGYASIFEEGMWWVLGHELE